MARIRMLAIVMMFVMTVVGCTNRGIDGIWVDKDDDSVQYTFNNGNFELSMSKEKITVKGTYTINRNELITIATHIKVEDWENEFDENQPEKGIIKGNTLVMTSENDGEIQTYTYIRKRETSTKNSGGSGKGGLSGTWEYENSYVDMTWTFSGNKLTQEVMGVKVTMPYTIKGNAIAMVYEGAEVEFDYKIDGDTLTVDMGMIEVEFKKVKK